MRFSDTGRGRLSAAQARALRRLLVACVAVWPDGDRREVRAALASHPPLERLAAAASLHRVASLVHDALRDVSGIPPQTRRDLAEATRQAAARHLRSVRALRDIGAALDDADIPWLVMKGPVLTAEIYRDAAARDYGDVDILVDRCRFPAAVEALEHAGFVHRIRNWPLASWFRAGEIQMVRGDVEVDLHWHLLYAHYDRRCYDLDIQAMIERRRDVLVGGREAPTLDAADTILALGLHTTRSGGHELRWLKDIELAYTTLRPDPDEIVGRCQDYGCAEAVGLALGRTESILGVDLGDDLSTRMSSRSVRLVDRVAQRFEPAIQLDDRDTLPRFVARSVRSSPSSTVVEAVRRTGRAMRREVGIGVGDESDDADERARYLALVAGQGAGT